MADLISNYWYALQRALESGYPVKVEKVNDGLTDSWLVEVGDVQKTAFDIRELPAMIDRATQERRDRNHEETKH